MQESVTVHMSASADAIWQLISDVTQIGRFSPETFEAEWLDGASGPAVGAKFRGHVKRNGIGPIYWTNCRVSSCEPGREFGFDIIAPGDRVVDTWAYSLAPSASGDGTDVTESFAIADNLPMKIYWAALGWARGKTNRDGMRKTLEAIKAVVET